MLAEGDFRAAAKAFREALALAERRCPRNCARPWQRYRA